MVINSLLALDVQNHSPSQQAEGEQTEIAQHVGPVFDRSGDSVKQVTIIKPRHKKVPIFRRTTANKSETRQFVYSAQQDCESPLENAHLKAPSDELLGQIDAFWLDFDARTQRINDIVDELL